MLVISLKKWFFLMNEWKSYLYSIPSGHFLGHFGKWFWFISEQTQMNEIARDFIK